MVQITLPDGTKKNFESPVTGMQVAQDIGEGLARAALAIKVNGTTQDLSQEIVEDSDVDILTFRQDEGKEVFWHSSAHVMAMAMKEIWPEIKLTIGPAIERGFYYDVEKADPFKPEDLEKIEAKMKEFVKKDLPFTRENITVEKAKELFKDNKYKLELIEEYKDTQLTIYKNESEFLDLCSGPHIPSTGRIKAFKLTKMSSAYWRGDETRESLQRVYGISYTDKKELKAYLHMMEEAAKRDHRKIAKEMGLLVFSEMVGSGMPLYTPKGTYLRKKIIEYSQELNAKIGFEEVHTPNMNKAELFKISGHYDKYKDDMFLVKSNHSKDEFYLKPMNCPQHTQIFASQPRSYRDLPIRFSDFANLHRDEKPGELSGLTRLRCFCQDDGHAFIRHDQIASEFKNILCAIKEALTTYGMEYYIRLSLRDPKDPEKYIGSDELWNDAESHLRNLLDESKMEYNEGIGEAAFYGPKMDIMARDALDREWQISTIQLDFNMPQRFELKYAHSDGTEKTPVMIHRAIVGSPERFMGILIEHYAGRFPLWLNPNQVAILPIADRFLDYADDVSNKFKQAGIRTYVDSRQESINKKVRDAQLQQYNYILVVGEKEIADQTVTVRTREGTVEGALPVEEFKIRLVTEIRDRS